jgi:hypothetical protein
MDNENQPHSEARTRDYVWAAVVAVVVAGFFNGVIWALYETVSAKHPERLVVVLIGTPAVYWLGVGAWRRTLWGRDGPITLKMLTRLGVFALIFLIGTFGISFAINYSRIQANQDRFQKLQQESKQICKSRSMVLCGGTGEHSSQQLYLPSATPSSARR